MIYIHIDLEVTLRLRDLRSTIDLDLMRSSYTYFDAYRREDLDGAVMFALTRASYDRVIVIGKSYWQQAPWPSSATILTFLPLRRHF